jgi:hypothetical protein
MADAPELSVILVSGGSLETLAVPLPGLRAQTIAKRIELIIVAERGRIDVADTAGIHGFHSVRLVEVDAPIQSRGRAAGAAISAVTAPFFALHENHARFEPHSYERMLAAHTASTAAVGPAVRAANAEDPVGLVMYAIAYGFCAPPVDPGPRHSLPYHNAVFVTGTIRRLPGSLSDWFAREGRLHAALLAHGFELRLAPDAEVWHVNEARPRRLLSDSWWIGRMFGHARSRDWPVIRRIGYAALLPAIAATTWRRLFRDLRRTPDAARRLHTAALWAVPAALAFAMGEVRGYVTTELPENPDFEKHELHVLGRLNGRRPELTWLREAVDAIPPGTP